MTPDNQIDSKVYGPPPYETASMRCGGRANREYVRIGAARPPAEAKNETAAKEDPQDLKKPRRSMIHRTKRVELYR